MNTTFPAIEKPTILVDERKARQHIAQMANKAVTNGAKLCPHFKTHQSSVVGNWFRDYGVTSITVSSVDMASYFADHGWKDITIALPVNIRQLDRIDALAERVSLSLMIESSEAIQALESRLTHSIKLWLSIDTGYGREGIDWSAVDEIAGFCRQIRRCRNLEVKGLMAHAGHTYDVQGKEAVTRIYVDTLQKITALRDQLAAQGVKDLSISVGDTPSCSLVDDFGHVDEIRPGTFVFYDLLQTGIGSCQEEDIAVAAACPVVGIYPQRNEIAIYGGGAHLSKDFNLGPTGEPSYGRVVRLENDQWGKSLPETEVTLLYQELGLVRTTSQICNQTHIGDVLLVLPAHVCLLVSTLRRYMTLSGLPFTCMPV